MKNYFSVCLLLWVGIATPLSSFANEGSGEMVRIQKGCFMMGTDKEFPYKMGWKNERERPSHKVCLDSFYIDRYEVTQKNWETVMGYNNTPMKGPDLPVSEIDWQQAVDYCSRVGRRLPTEAEWEYAARAGNQADNPWGNGIDRDYLWYGGNSFRKLSPVGKKKPNAWGLHDMMGSVWEWVSDWYSEDYYKNSPLNNPRGPARQSWRVIRGGSWIDEEEYIRVTVRYQGMSDPTEDFWVGVRCAKSLPKGNK
jgi:formylglycine-generating enzyme required for sulfatase activity